MRRQNDPIINEIPRAKNKQTYSTAYFKTIATISETRNLLTTRESCQLRCILVVSKTWFHFYWYLDTEMSQSYFLVKDQDSPFLKLGSMANWQSGQSASYA